MSDDEKIEYIVKRGHELAHLVRAATTVAELKTIIPEVDKYYDFIDEFMNDSEDENGVPSEESNDVAFLLYYAIEEKQRQIEYFPDEIGAADSEIDNFEDYLDDKEWLKYRRF